MKQDGVHLQDISRLCDLEIDILLIFLPDIELPVDIKENIRKFIDAGYGKDDLISSLKLLNSSEVKYLLERVANDTVRLTSSVAEQETGHKLKDNSSDNKFQQINYADQLYLNGLKFYQYKSYRESEMMFRKCLLIRKEVLPPNHLDLANIYNILGSTLIKLKSFSEAVEMLIEYEKIKKKITPVSRNVISLIQNQIKCVRSCSQHFF